MKTIVVVLLFIAIAVGGFYLGQKYKVVPATEPLTITEMPTPTQSPTQGVTPTIVDEQTAVVAAVRAGLVAKHGESAKNLDVRVSTIVNSYAKGSASEEGGGGMWFAAKVNGEWKLVWDGNGVIECESIEQYNFPRELIPECFNSKTGVLIQR